MTILIGIDAGGSKTEAVAYTPEGREISRALEGTGNLMVNRDQAIGHITRAIQRVLPDGPCDARIYVGAAGITAGDHEAVLYRALRERFPDAHLRIVHDACLALYAAFQGSDGMILIAGTGSIAYAKQGATMRRAGGWGQLLGDEGSGYDIVRKAFVHCTQEYDEGIPHGPLTRRLLDHLHTDVFGAVQFVHTATKTDIAALMPMVVEIAAQGDAVAGALLRYAGDMLAKLALKLHRCAGFSGPLPLVCKGSVLEKIPPISEHLRARLAERADALHLRTFHSSPTEGARYLYQEEQQGGPA